MNRGNMNLEIYDRKSDLFIRAREYALIVMYYKLAIDLDNTNHVVCISLFDCFQSERAI